jgi:hypothetical protein
VTLIPVSSSDLRMIHMLSVEVPPPAITQTIDVRHCPFKVPSLPRIRGAVNLLISNPSDTAVPAAMKYEIKVS